MSSDKRSNTLENYEVVTPNNKGALFITYNATDLVYDDGADLKCQIEGSALLVLAPVPFVINDLPKNAIEYISETGSVQILELEQKDNANEPGRLATISLH